MEVDKFSEIEETISFYTRNDFAIINCLLADDMDDLWNSARVAYNDNKAILKEFEDGVREITSSYDRKWIHILQGRLIEKLDDELDDEAKEKIIKNAKNDISNIFSAMSPAGEALKLYRTAWVTNSIETDHVYPYAHQHQSLLLETGTVTEIKIISSTSLTPYREDDEIACDYYRYEILVPKNGLVLKLDQFECHNEEGEVLLPPMKCKVNNIHPSGKKRCRGIIELEYIERLPINI